MKIKALRELKLNELFQLLELRDITGKIVEQYFQEQEKAFAEKQLSLQHEINMQSASQACRTVIEEISDPIYFCWALSSVVKMGPAAAPFSLASLAIIFIFGLCIFPIEYKRNKEIRAHEERFFQDIYLKQMVAHEILHRYQGEFYSSVVTELPVGQLPLLDDQAESVSKRDSIRVAVIVSSTLFVGCYWGVSSILELAGLLTVSSALLGPAGVAIAVGASLAIGLFLGYQHYQMKKREKYIAVVKENAEGQLTQLREQCYESRRAARVTNAVAQYSSGMRRVSSLDNMSAFFRRKQLFSDCVGPLSLVPQFA